MPLVRGPAGSFGNQSPGDHDPRPTSEIDRPFIHRRPTGRRRAQGPGARHQQLADSSCVLDDRPTPAAIRQWRAPDVGREYTPTFGGPRRPEKPAQLEEPALQRSPDLDTPLFIQWCHRRSWARFSTAFRDEPTQAQPVDVNSHDIRFSSVQHVLLKLGQLAGAPACKYSCSSSDSVQLNSGEVKTRFSPHGGHTLWHKSSCFVQDALAQLCSHESIHIYVTPCGHRTLPESACMTYTYRRGRHAGDGKT